MDKNFSKFSIKRQNIRTLSLVICTLIYLLTGAAVFDSLESKTEHKNKQTLLEQIEKFRLKVNMSDAEFEGLYKHMIKKGNYNRNLQWEFPGSFFFCTLALALIGYGHSTPATTVGKLFCIVYTSFGIPMSLITFQSVGERINVLLKYLIERFKSSSYSFHDFKNKEASSKDLIVAEFVLTIILILSGSFVFSKYESWSYFDAIYYCFTTLTTIGFGDYVPLQKHDFLKKNPFYVSFTVLFIITGLTILASSINLLVLYLVNINSEEELEKRMTLKRKKQEQLQKRLIGDVILTVNRQEIVTHLDELPNLALLNDDKSVCSCDDIKACYQAYSNKIKTESKFYFMRKTIVNKKNEKDKNMLKHFTVMRQPNKKIEHLLFDSSNNNSDYILDNGLIKKKLKRLDNYNFNIKKSSRRTSI